MIGPAVLVLESKVGERCFAAHAIDQVCDYDRNTGALLCDTSTLSGPTLTRTKPLGVTVQTNATSNSTTIWVAVGNRSVMKLTWNGTRLVDSGTAITGLSDPSGVTYGGPNNHLFIADTTNC